MSFTNHTTKNLMNSNHHHHGSFFCPTPSNLATTWTWACHLKSGSLTLFGMPFACCSCLILPDPGRLFSCLIIHHPVASLITLLITWRSQFSTVSYPCLNFNPVSWSRNKVENSLLFSKYESTISLPYLYGN